MEKFKVNRNKWHYRFMDTMLCISSDEPKDFCTYWRNFIGACMLVIVYLCIIASAFILAWVVLVAIFNVFLLYPLYSSLFWGAIIASSFIMYISRKKNVSRNKFESSEPGLIKTKYRSWKEKYCPMMEYED